MMKLTIRHVFVVIAILCYLLTLYSVKMTQHYFTTTSTPSNEIIHCHPRQQSTYLYQSRRNDKNLDINTKGKAHSMSNKEISCDYIRQQVIGGKWKDPNDGQVYIRRILSLPNHYMSVHSKQYDRVRFNSIFESGNYYEHKVHNRFIRILSEEENKQQPRRMVIDVGANIGYYSLMSAVMNHTVYSFEINPTNLIRICESIHWNNNYYYYSNMPLSSSSSSSSSQQGQQSMMRMMAPIHLFRNGVSNQHNINVHVNIPKRNPGEAHVTMPTPSTAVAANSMNNDTDLSIYTSLTAASSNEYAYIGQHSSKVTTITLDVFANEQGWFDVENTQPSDDFSVIAILKIDTEGHEPQILQGAKRVLRSGLIQNVLLEYRTTCYDAVMDTLLTDEAGYVLVYDKTDHSIRRPTTMLSMNSSKAYIDKIHRSGSLIDKDGKDDLKYEDLWFRLKTHSLPK